VNYVSFAIGAGISPPDSAVRVAAVNRMQAIDKELSRRREEMAMTHDTWARLPREPKHKLPQCTDYELRDYRAELEESPEESPGHAVLKERLEAVTAEQDSRRRPVAHR
jgi:hypothetical protein